MNLLKHKLFGESWVFYLNFFILQWFFIRLYYTIGQEPIQWGFLKRIIPLTGWWNDFKKI